MKSGAKSITVAVAALCSLALVSGCGKHDDQKCDLLPSDQNQSMSVALKDFPQRLLIDQRLSSDQQNAVTQAAKTWNDLGARMMGKEVFEVSVGDVTAMSATDGCGFPHVPEGTVPVIRESDMDQWRSLQLSSANLAVTRRCTSGSQVKQQGIIINVSLVHDKQFASIALHEMGHVIGLEHSCAGAGETVTSGFVACKGLPAGHEYVDAVMFPTLGYLPGTAMLETKEDLRSNDTLRAGCVFKK